MDDRPPLSPTVSTNRHLVGCRFRFFTDHRPLWFQTFTAATRLQLSRALQRRLVAAKLALYEEEAQLKQRLGPCSFSLSPQLSP